MKELYVIRYLFVISILLFSSCVEAEEYSRKELNSVDTLYAKIQLKAEYANLLLFTYEQGEKKFVEKINKVDWQSIKGWKEVVSKHNVEFLIAIAPIRASGSISGIFFRAGEDKWKICRISENLNNVEQEVKLLTNAYPICFSGEA